MKDREQLKLSADGGDRAAQLELGAALLRGEGGPQNIQQGIHYLKLACAYGDSAAAYELGAYYHGERDAVNAFFWYGEAAARGHGLSQYCLGALHERGAGAAADRTRVIPLYRSAAGQGVLAAQVALARVYLEGKLAPIDHAQAFAWMETAAQGGDFQSAHYLGGVLLHGGLGRHADAAQALRWYEQAARFAGSDDQAEAARAGVSAAAAAIATAAAAAGMYPPSYAAPPYQGFGAHTQAADGQHAVRTQAADFINQTAASESAQPGAGGSFSENLNQSANAYKNAETAASNSSSQAGGSSSQPGGAGTANAGAYSGANTYSYNANFQQSYSQYAPPYGQAYYGGYGYAPRPAEKKLGLAIASMVLGIISLFMFYTGALAGIPAIIMAAQSNKKYGKNGMAIAGLVTGIISTAITAMFVILVMTVLRFTL